MPAGCWPGAYVNASGRIFARDLCHGPGLCVCNFAGAWSAEAPRIFAMTGCDCCPHDLCRLWVCSRRACRIFAWGAAFRMSVAKVKASLFHSGGTSRRRDFDFASITWVELQGRLQLDCTLFCFRTTFAFPARSKVSQHNAATLARMFFEKTGVRRRPAHMHSQLRVAEPEANVTSMYLCSYLSLSTYLSINLIIYPSIHLSIYPSIHLSIYPS